MTRHFIDFFKWRQLQDKTEDKTTNMSSSVCYRIKWVKIMLQKGCRGILQN